MIWDFVHKVGLAGREISQAGGVELADVYLFEDNLFMFSYYFLSFSRRTGCLSTNRIG